MNLKTGKCESCGSTEIYTNRKSNARGERASIVVSPFKFFYVDTYICMGCAKFEEYLNEKTFKDEVSQAKIKKLWKKV